MSKLGKDRVVWDSEINKKLENYDNEYNKSLKKLNNLFNFSLLKDVQTHEFTVNQPIGLPTLQNTIYSEVINNDNTLKHIMFYARLYGSNRNMNKDITYNFIFSDSTNTIKYNNVIMHGNITLMNSSYGSLGKLPCLVTLNENKINFEVTPTINGISGIYYADFEVNGYNINLNNNETAS